MSRRLTADPGLMVEMLRQAEQAVPPAEFSVACPVCRVGIMAVSVPRPMTCFAVCRDCEARIGAEADALPEGEVGSMTLMMPPDSSVSHVEWDEPRVGN